MIGFVLSNGARGATVQLETDQVIMIPMRRVRDKPKAGDVVELTPHGKRYRPCHWSIVSVRLRALSGAHD